MASHTFGLAVPVLVSLYRGLKGIAMPQSLLIYGYSFQAIMFIVACILLPDLSCDVSCPLGPLMVHFSDPLTKPSNIGDVCKMIHERKVFELGCLMLAKNRLEIILDYRKLDDVRSDYLVAFQDGFLPICCGVSFHVEHHSPH